MDHAQAVQLKATERYLLNELEPQERDQFEEHLFDCQECAVDVRAAAMFVEQTKIALAETPLSHASQSVLAAKERPRSGWFAWFRPAFAVPVLALLLAVIGYQNLVTYRHVTEAVNQPQVRPWASVNVSTRGAATTVVKALPGQDFDLLVSIPPDAAYSAYTLDLYAPSGKLQWSLKIAASAVEDTQSLQVPGKGLEAGTYKLSVTAWNPAGQSTALGSSPIELQFQK
ncbi:MAG TPA: zf-HC2 domain-containing protein [Candidatus Sulfotelmatobacter sp.]|nr:zf-HC2 domain-containing protein [Candidatus Sulfotelmatobacter sp.]